MPVKGASRNVEVKTKTKTEMKMCSYGPLKRKEGPTSGTGSGFDGFINSDFYKI